MQVVEQLEQNALKGGCEGLPGSGVDGKLEEEVPSADQLMDQCREWATMLINTVHPSQVLKGEMFYL